MSCWLHFWPRSLLIYLGRQKMVPMLWPLPPTPTQRAQKTLAPGFILAQPRLLQPGEQTSRLKKPCTCLCFWHSFLLMCLGGTRWYSTCLDPCHPCGEPRLSSSLHPVSAPKCCTWKVNQWTKNLSLPSPNTISPSLCLWERYIGRQMDR